MTINFENFRHATKWTVVTQDGTIVARFGSEYAARDYAAKYSKFSRVLSPSDVWVVG